MSEPSLTKLQSPRDNIEYRAISLFAVLGSVCSSAFACLAVSFVAGAIVKGTPPLLSRAALVLPIAGVILCLLGLRRIRLSENTQTGEKLAYVGIWLGVVSGLGYFAYDFGSGWAITQQANNFLSYVDKNAPNESGFFEHIQNGDLNRAFLLTKPFQNRQGVNPDDQRQMDFVFDRTRKSLKGELSQFSKHDFVYILGQGGGHLPIPMGVKRWQYKNGSYIVERNYRVSNPELEYHFSVTVASSEGDVPGQGRKWKVQWPVEPLPSSQRSEFGAHIAKLRNLSGAFFFDWCRSLTSKKKPKTFPNDLTKWKQLNVLKEAFREPLRLQVSDYFQGKRERFPANITSPPLTPWKQTKDSRLQVTHFFSLPVFPDSDNPNFEYSAEGSAVLQSREPLDPHKGDETSDWEVVSFEVTHIRPPQTPNKELEMMSK